MTEVALDSSRPPPADAAEPAGVDGFKVLLGFGGMVLGQFMATLDIQIVASSLAQIQAGVGASADEISWVQTIYLLAEVVVIPLTAYLTKMWGTRPVYVWAAGAFIVTSIMTGLSNSFETMILTRALQGLAAGAMIPSVFATAMTVFPPERRVTANVIMGLIVTLAPTVGPTLGGHITELLSWRWLFFINIPPGLAVIFLVGRYGGFDKGDPRLAKGIDWLGVVTMTAFLLSTQFVIEEGSKDGWFQDDGILWLTVLACVTGVVFVWRQLTYRQPIVSLKPFGDRNFTLGSLMMFVSGASLFGGMFVLPLYLAQIMNYSSAEVGTHMIAGGLTMFVTAPLAGRLVRRVDARVAMVLGFSLAAYGMGQGARVNVNWDYWDFAVMQSVRGVGIMVAMIASQQLTVSTLPGHLMKDAAGLVNLVRNVGGAIGLAIISTLLTHQTAVHMMDLTSIVSAGDAASQTMVNGFSAIMQEGASADPDGAARKAFFGLLHRNAAMLAFGDSFVLLAAGCALTALLAVFVKPAPAELHATDGWGH